MLAAVIANMRLRRDEVVIMDTHAGVEHFGRALARGFDRALVVVEPTFNSVQVGLDTARLASELGIETIDLIVNQCRDAGDLERAVSCLDRLGGFDFSSINELPFDANVAASEPSVGDLLDGTPLAEAMDDLARHLYSRACDVERRADGMSVSG
jgi:CO dehydrogenase maturation factor